MNESDLFLQECFSLILAELTKEFYGTSRFLKESFNLDYLFRLIQSPNPDVQKNSIEIISNLVKDLVGIQAIVTSKVI